jgi:hypothetical protein
MPNKFNQSNLELTISVTHTPKKHDKVGEISKQDARNITTSSNTYKETQV